MKRRLWRRIPFVLLLALLAAGFAWVETPYRADEMALRALESGGEVQVTAASYGWFFDGPDTEDALIFYPGARVEASAYAPLLRRVAAGGVDVCLVRMPLNLAFLGTEKATAVMEQYEYRHWSLGGHSLGGAMAALYASSQGTRLESLVLCAAYPTGPLPEQLTELLLCGTEDGVLNRERFEAGRAYDTAHTAVLWIEGGNHAQFGSYGAQKGDGAAAISAEEQWDTAAAFILRELGKETAT